MGRMKSGGRCLCEGGNGVRRYSRRPSLHERRLQAHRGRWRGQLRLAMDRLQMLLNELNCMLM